MRGQLLALVLLATTVAAGSAMAAEPFEVIEEAIVEIASGVEDQREVFTTDKAALHTFIDSILLPRFDRRYAAQLVLAKHWRAASTAQRDRFINAFYASLLKKYAEGVLEFREDRIRLLPFRGDLTSKRTIVRTIVTLADGSKVTVNYGFANRKDEWKIFDVTIEGISYIRNFRAELDSEIRSTSLEAVITRLESDAGTSADE